MNEYTVLINGVEHTIQLADAEAKARGLVPTSKAQTANNKARTAANKTKG